MVNGLEVLIDRNRPPMCALNLPCSVAQAGHTFFGFAGE